MSEKPKFQISSTALKKNLWLYYVLIQTFYQMSQPGKAVSLGLKKLLKMKFFVNMPYKGVNRMYYGQVSNFWQNCW